LRFSIDYAVCCCKSQQQQKLTRQQHQQHSSNTNCTAATHTARIGSQIEGFKKNYIRILLYVNFNKNINKNAYKNRYDIIFSRKIVDKLLYKSG